MSDSAEISGKELVDFLRNRGFLSNDSLRISGWNDAGLVLEFASIVRAAFGIPDEEIPFGEEYHE